MKNNLCFWLAGCVALFLLSACGVDWNSYNPSLMNIKLTSQSCRDLPCFVRFLREPHRTYTETAEDGSTLTIREWDALVRRERESTTVEKKFSDTEYRGYYSDCTLRVAFDQNDKALNFSYLGSGCFTKDGRLYEEGKLFIYDE